MCSSVSAERSTNASKMRRNTSHALCGPVFTQPAYSASNTGFWLKRTVMSKRCVSTKPIAVSDSRASPEAGSGGDASSEQPSSCAEAANENSYVGCEFWPTIVFNPVWSVFDFAAVVANASTQPAVQAWKVRSSRR